MAADGPATANIRIDCTGADKWRTMIGGS